MLALVQLLMLQQGKTQVKIDPESNWCWCLRWSGTDDDACPDADVDVDADADADTYDDATARQNRG